METKSVGIREFRAGLAEFIDNKQPVAVTRHGQTVGFFIPTARPAQADLQARRNAADKLEAVLSLSEDTVEALFETSTPCAKAHQHADAHRSDASRHRP
jgi:hypothetical protein